MRLFEQSISVRLIQVDTNRTDTTKSALSFVHLNDAFFL
jgi:hypothetical protein